MVMFYLKKEDVISWGDCCVKRNIEYRVLCQCKSRFIEEKKLVFVWV